MRVEAAPNTQQTIGVRIGRPEKTSVTVVVKSASSSDATVAIAGQIVTIPMVALGTDSGTALTEAGFVGSKMVGGLSPRTKYPYKVYQDNNIVSKDENGKAFYTWTGVEANHDFILITSSCINSGSTDGNPIGTFFKEVRRICEANPNTPVYMAQVEDHDGYIDLNTVNEGAFGSGHVVGGYPNAAFTTAEVYAYALAVFAAFGLYHPNGISETTWGQDADVIWCMRNVSFIPQSGDHDSGRNEMGWDVSPTDDTGLAPTPKTQFDNAKVVWDACYKPLQGSALNGNDNSWQHTLGCVKLIAPDGISQASGDATVNTGDLSTEFKPPTTIYGQAQCDDLVSACDDDNAYFKFSLTNYGGRWTVPDPVTAIPVEDAKQEGRNGRGCQNPIAGNESYAVPRPAHVDYKRWITDENGIMGKDSCNGTSGQFGMLGGDYHSAGVQFNANTSGFHDESFTTINLGTGTGSTNFPSPNEVGNTYDGTTVEMESGSVRFGNDWWVVAMFVYGSRSTKEIEVQINDKNGVNLWPKKFVEGMGNAGQVM